MNTCYHLRGRCAMQFAWPHTMSTILTENLGSSTFILRTCGLHWACLGQQKKFLGRNLISPQTFQSCHMSYNTPAPLYVRMLTLPESGYNKRTQLYLQLVFYGPKKKLRILTTLLSCYGECVLVWTDLCCTRKCSNFHCCCHLNTDVVGT